MFKTDKKQQQTIKSKINIYGICKSYQVSSFGGKLSGGGGGLSIYD